MCMEAHTVSQIKALINDLGEYVGCSSEKNLSFSNYRLISMKRLSNI